MYAVSPRNTCSHRTRPTRLHLRQRVFAGISAGWFRASLYHGARDLRHSTNLDRLAILRAWSARSVRSAGESVRCALSGSSRPPTIKAIIAVRSAARRGTQRTVRLASRPSANTRSSNHLDAEPLGGPDRHHILSGLFSVAAVRSREL